MEQYKNADECQAIAHLTALPFPNSMACHQEQWDWQDRIWETHLVPARNQIPAARSVMMLHGTDVPGTDEPGNTISQSPGPQPQT